MKKKVLVFITRQNEGRCELLVFDHRDHPDAGTQIPAGTVEDDENIKAAAIREVFEESGLRLSDPGKLLGQFDYIFDDGKRRELRHVFHLNIGIQTRDYWEHTVGGDGVDQGMIFRYYWVPLSNAHLKLHRYQNEYLKFISSSD